MHKILQLIKDNQAVAQPLNVVRNADEASLYIYDVIDDYFGVNAKQVATALNAVKDASTLNVYINSPGGSVFEAKAVMAELQRFSGNKIAHIDSLCASAATSIALACNEIRMADGAFFMIHNATSILAYGDKDDLRAAADLLEKVENTIVQDYINKTGKDEAEIRAMMSAETWLTAAEAKEHGFVDVVTPSPTATNLTTTWNLAAFGNAPQALSASAQPAATPVAEGLRMTQTNTNKLQLLTIL